MIIIKTLHFENYEDFACAVSDVYDRVKSDDEYNSVDVVAKYEDAKEIIRELVGIGYDIAFIDKFGNPEWDGYDDSFVISLLDDDIWCEPVKRDDKYIFVEADVVYILTIAILRLFQRLKLMKFMKWKLAINIMIAIAIAMVIVRTVIVLMKLIYILPKMKM